MLLYSAIVGFLYFSYIFVMVAVMNKKSLYKIPAEKTVLIMGDSRPTYGINDSLLDNAVNIAQVGLPYLYTYEVLKKVLPLNPQIHTVILGCGAHDIQKRIADIWLRREFLSDKLHNYFHLMTADELFYMFRYNPEQVIKDVISLPKSKTPLFLKVLRQKKVSFKELRIGGYEYIAGALDLKRACADLDKIKNEDQRTSSTWQIGYLHKIVELCRAKNIKIIFLRTPEQKLCPIENEDIFIKTLHEQFGDVPFKDDLKMYFPDSCFWDLDHLNHYGAVPYTDSIKAFLKTLN